MSAELYSLYSLENIAKAAGTLLAWPNTNDFVRDNANFILAAVKSINEREAAQPSATEKAQFMERMPTLRDQFAMAALEGCLAYSYVNPSHGNYQENCTPELTAKAAYGYADAMLAEREGKR